MRSEGMMRVVAFESRPEWGGVTLAISELLKEAGEWLESRTKMTLPYTLNQKLAIWNVSVSLTVDDDDDLDRPVVNLYLHYDSNEPEG